VSFKLEELRRQQGWLYLGKMVLSAGRAEIKLTTQRVKGKGQSSNQIVNLHMITEQHWEAEK
jgi:hypothetical protein